MANTNSDYSNFFPAPRKTRLPGGYMGKMLRVDLSTGKFTDLNIPEEPLLRKYWGGQLMAEFILLNELPLGIDPYDPENVIVGMTGPVTGTGFTPGGTKTCFVYLSPATRYTLGRAATSGYFGSSLKSAGYDGVIISGSMSAKTRLNSATQAKCGAKACAQPKICCAPNPATRTRASALSVRPANTSFERRCSSTTTIIPRRMAWAR